MRLDFKCQAKVTEIMLCFLLVIYFANHFDSHLKIGSQDWTLNRIFTNVYYLRYIGMFLSFSFYKPFFSGLCHLVHFN